MSIKPFPNYKHLLQENYVEYKHIFLPLLKLVSKILCHLFILMLQFFLPIVLLFLLHFVLICTVAVLYCFVMCVRVCVCVCVGFVMCVYVWVL